MKPATDAVKYRTERPLAASEMGRAVQREATYAAESKETAGRGTAALTCDGPYFILKEKCYIYIYLVNT